MTHKFRIAEIFGPTIQGEGRRAGIPCHFIRFGGCDYRCVWCDSPQAVLPDKVAQLPMMTEEQIYDAVRALPRGPAWVVLSGGNPALLDLHLLCGYLQQNYSVMVETQGTVYRDWLGYVDELCVSPKPPSSRNTTSVKVLRNFMQSTYDSPLHSLGVCYLKVVVFDAVDYDYAREVRKEFPNHLMFLSVGTHHPNMPTVGNPDVAPVEEYKGMRQQVAQDFRILAETLSKDQLMRDVRVLPQLHVIAWGNERGR